MYAGTWGAQPNLWGALPSRHAQSQLLVFL